MILFLVSLVYGFLCGRNVNHKAVKLWYEANKEYLVENYKLFGIASLQREIIEFEENEVFAQQLENIKDKQKESKDINNEFESAFV